MTRALMLVLGLLVGLPQAAFAWWNADWTQRKKITLDTSASGADIREEVGALVVPIRLHTGNFAFADAKQDGSDLRFVAADDKTPLPHHVERIDSLNELAIVWVRVPRLAASSRDNVLWMYYGNPKAPAAADAKGTYEPAQLGVYHFGADGLHQDATGHGHHASGKAGRPSATGFIDGALALDGRAPMQIAPAPSLSLPAAGGVTLGAWIKPAQVARASTLFSVGSGQTGLVVALEGGKLSARWGGGTPARAEAARTVEAGTWVHVAVTLSANRLAIYVDGVESGGVPAKMADLTGPVEIGAGYEGEIDEVQVANVARSAGWIKAAHASQAPQGKLVVDAPAEAAGGDGGSSYMTILLGAVTIDGWIVIAILAVMAVVSVAVMAGKGMLVARTARANLAFRERFDAMLDSPDRLGGQTDPQLGASSLYRLYAIGIAELDRRLASHERAGTAKHLSPQALGAIKATIDAGLVRENERLNRQMVLLTIAISGGPFLGLLGTVVGVMITFAAIAAVGDVNVNSIAPGIAAALVATVAGLGVAIPALFGYNYLASRIRELSNDAAVFADELVSRFAEKFAP